MDSFLMVRPTGTALNDKVGGWASAEMAHALDHWRSQFRGDARVKDDKDVSDADVAAHNLILWGDPSSNAVLAKIADKLPVTWTKDGVQLGAETHDAGHHVPVMIYPNPLNPKHYVVLNSGFTFREYDYLSNARQVPKLPDFAIIDVSSPATSRAPGRHHPGRLLRRSVEATGRRARRKIAEREKSGGSHRSPPVEEVHSEHPPGTSRTRTRRVIPAATPPTGPAQRPPRF